MDLNELQELSEWQRLARGDCTALNELVPRCKPFVSRILRKILDQDVEDIESEVWMKIMQKVLEKPDYIRGPGLGQFRAWLKITTQTTAFDHLRKSSRNPLDNAIKNAPSTSHVKDADSEAMIREISDVQFSKSRRHGSPEDCIVAYIELKQLLMNENEVDDKDRVLFTGGLEGKTLKEIATDPRVALTPQAVNARQQKLHQKISNILSPKVLNTSAQRKEPTNEAHTQNTESNHDKDEVDLTRAYAQPEREDRPFATFSCRPATDLKKA